MNRTKANEKKLEANEQIVLVHATTMGAIIHTYIHDENPILAMLINKPKCQENLELNYFALCFFYYIVPSSTAKSRNVYIQFNGMLLELIRNNCQVS